MDDTLADSAPPKGAQLRQVAVWWAVALLVAIVGLLSLQRHNDRVDAASKARFEAASNHVPEMLAAVSYRQDGVGEMAPAVVWTGKGARVLAVRYYLDDGYILVPAAHTWDILARTASGKLFTVMIKLRKDDDSCEPADIVKCTSVTKFSPMPEEELKPYVYRVLQDRKLYRQLFNEEMPPAEVPA